MRFQPAPGVDIQLNEKPLTSVVELTVPYDRGDVLAAIHREGEVVSTSDGAAAMTVRARLSEPSAGRLSEFIVGNGGNG